MEKVILLHGALGAKEQFVALEKELENVFDCHAINFSGHGGYLPDIPELGFDNFIEDISLWHQGFNYEPIHFFGYSMGGYAALLYSLKFPERVKSIFTLGTKFDWTPESFAKEAAMLDPEKLKAKVPAFADILKQRHSPADWELLLKHTVLMMKGLTENTPLNTSTLTKISVPVCISVGDKDNMASTETTLPAFRSIPNAQMLVLPSTYHPLEKIDVELLAHHYTRFIMKLSRR
jgi:pimeloyl-ACP methyl ester carboxylesterase